jgi:hypothetical protein
MEAMMRKKSLVTLYILVLLISLSSFAPKAIAATEKQSKLQTSLYNYLTVPANRKSIEKAARRLNRGSHHNTCVYFASEALRRVGFMVPKSVCNTRQLVPFLKSKGWRVSYNLHELKPGDICFTTNNDLGSPSHAHVFMGWVKGGSIDYAYIVDNQSVDYNGNTYHIRNIRKKLRDKDATRFFMYKPN